MSKFDKRDNKILDALMNSEEPLTAYAVAKGTELAISTVQYKLNELLKLGLVEDQNEGTIKYTVHPILLMNKDLRRIFKHIEGVSEIIDAVKPMNPDGMKALILYVINHTKFVKKYD